MEEEEEAKEKEEEEEAFSYLCTQKGAEEEEIPDPSFLLIWTPREREGEGESHRIFPLFTCGEADTDRS